jgi:hypothetical protein
MAEWNDSLVELKRLVTSLRSSPTTDTMVGFTIESSLELLKAFIKSDWEKEPVQQIMRQYIDHVVTFVETHTGLEQQKEIQKMRSLISVVGPDLCEHIVSFVEQDTVLRLSSVCKVLNLIAMKRVWRKVTVESRWRTMHSRETGNQLSFDSKGVSFIKELSCTFKTCSLANCELITGMTFKIKSLKHLQLNLLGTEGFQRAFYWLGAALTFHHRSLESFSLVIEEAILKNLLEVSKFLGLLATLRLKSFSLASDDDGLRFLDMKLLFNHFSNSLKTLSLHDCGRLMNFDVLSKFTFNELHLSCVEVPEEFLESFARILSQVSFLTLITVKFPNSESWFQALPNGTKYWTLKQLTIKPFELNQVNILQCIPNLEILELEDPRCFCDISKWQSEMFPNLRRFLMHSLKCDVPFSRDVEALRSTFKSLERVEWNGGLSKNFLWTAASQDTSESSLTQRFSGTLDRISSEWSYDNKPSQSNPSKKRKKHHTSD